MSTAPGPFSCPVCGEEVPWNAKACPACGACEKSGWSGDVHGELGLPDESFDYDSFVEEEFGGGRKKSAKDWLWWFAALLALAGFVSVMFLR